jgi:hypothetical protein
MALDYFSIEEFRAQPDVPESKYNDAAVTAAAEYVQGIVEGHCGTSFVGRQAVETLDGTGTTTLRLATPYVLGVDSVTVNGTVLTDEYVVDAGVLERRAAGSFSSLSWSRGRRNVVVTYRAGYSDEPPADLKGAVIQAVRARLMATSSQATIDDRRTSLNTDMGVINYVIAGQERPTGYPEVDAVIMRWAKKLNTVTYP